MRLAFALVSTLAGFAAADLYRLDNGRPEPLREFSLPADVRDPLLALVVGLLDLDAYGGLNPAAIDSVVSAHGGSKLPYREVRSVDRRPRTDAALASVAVQLRDDLHLPVPYSILGYNPGSMAASRSFVLNEWRLSEFRVTVLKDGKSKELSFDDVQLFGVSSGWLRMDVDWWLDKLMGPKLDDTQLVGVALVRLKGRRLAVAFGYTEAKQGRTGVFDLAKDQPIFPAPRELLVLGRELRGEVERRMAALAAGAQGD